MKTRSVAFVIAAAAVIGSSSAIADWMPGDPHKMHYPQLPDPNGWDVNVQTITLADDFLCTQSGPITEVHLWVSWQGDQLIDPGLIGNIRLSIHDNVLAGVNAPWSMPGELLWARDIPGPEIIHSGPFFGDQGWYDPETGQFARPDHLAFFQLNITNIPDPYRQTAGEIYWLDVQIDDPNPGLVGWKTTLDHWEDDAVWWNEAAQMWEELRDPITGESLDFAFVIVPEPAGAMLLGFGFAGVLLLRRRRG